MTTPLAADYGQSLQDAFTTFTTFIPRLIGALVILLVGYFIAKVVAKILDRVLEKFSFDQAVERGPVKTALSKSQYDASDIVSKLAFYAIFIPFLSAAVGALGIQALQQPLTNFINLIPQIIVAVIIIVVGGIVAGAAKRLIESSLGGLSYGTILADGVGVLVILVFLKAALDQVGIATTVTGPILYALLAAAAGIAIVGVGGGLIKPMQSRLEDALTKGAQETKKAKQEVQSNSGSSDDKRTAPYPSGSSSTASSVRRS